MIKDKLGHRLSDSANDLDVFLRPFTRRDVLRCGVATAFGSQIYAHSAEAAATQIGPIRSIADYEQALALAGTRSRYAVVDVGATWCAFCNTLDNEIFPNPRIKQAMKRMGLIRIDVSAWNADTLSLMQRLFVQGPPTVFVVDIETGAEISGTRSLGYFEVDDLAARLKPFT